MKSLWIFLFALSIPAFAHDIAITTGYANSSTPKVGSRVSQSHKPFRAGGGYAVGVRVDIEPPDRHVIFGPSFLFWNNLTGDPDPNANAVYNQIELGGRLSYQTLRSPHLYAGAGLAYAFAHGSVKQRAYNPGPEDTYDGEFPTGSVHMGFKSPTTNEALGIIGELGYVFGLGDASGERSVGPANAFLVQIGLAFGFRAGGE